VKNRQTEIHFYIYRYELNMQLTNVMCFTAAGISVSFRLLYYFELILFVPIFIIIHLSVLMSKHILKVTVKLA